MKRIGFGVALLALAVTEAAPGQGHTRPERGHHGDRGHRHDGPRRHEHGAEADPKVRPGSEVENFALVDHAGNAFELKALRRTEANNGGIAVLTFWCTTCASCRQIERTFDQKAKEYQDRGVRFFMVDSNHTDTAQQVNRFLTVNELSFPVLMDSESKVARQFGATLTTTTAVIDTDGRLRYYGGFRKAEDAIRDLLAGQDVEVPQSSGSG